MLPSSGAWQLRTTAPGGSCRLGLHHRQRHVAQTHAAPLRRHVGKPQPGPRGLLAQLQDGDEVLVREVTFPSSSNPLTRGPQGVPDEGTARGP